MSAFSFYTTDHIKHSNPIAQKTTQKSFQAAIQKAMPSLFFFFVALLLTPHFAKANNYQPEQALSVTIYSPDKSQAWSLDYSKPARLSQIVSDNIATQLQRNSLRADNIYWPGSSLTNSATPENKSSVLKQIDQLVDKEPIGFAAKASLRANERWINHNIFYSRQFIPLDFDAIRLNKKLNPFLSGEYHLYLPNRPNNVLIIGAVQKPTSLEWRPRLPAKQYLAKTALIEGHQKDFAAVIQPDGTVEQHPIAYWNKNHMDIAPGATIYIGYNSLPTDYEKLNEEMIDLLRNKVL
ncbi:capsule biosynthesis GfcC family protein [Photobacterium sp. DNB23_23_1]